MLRAPLASFYKNKVIFLTGCTGLLGTATAEKLLRSFPDIKKIILMVRPSRKLNVEARMRRYTEDIALSRIQPQVLASKISWMVGNLTSKKLGLSDENVATLVDSVNVVLHVAATVSFNAPVAKALAINLRGTREILEISSKMKNLQSFVYVSSCYSNCNRKRIEEKLYPNKFPPELLLKMMDDLDEATINRMQSVFVQDWPNTYTFSKNVTELLVDNYKQKFPIGIFRPASIIPSYKEPFPSWFRGDIGTNFVITAACLGIEKVIPSNRAGNTCFIPVDMTSNALLAAAWEVAQKSDKDVIIYNYSSTPNVLTMSDYVKLSLKHASVCKFEKAVGNYPNLYFMTNNEVLYKILRLMWHTLPAYALDVYLKLTGNQPKFVKLYKTHHFQMDIFRFFNAALDWTFVYGNVGKLWKKMTKEEQDLLYFDVVSLNWEKCLATAPFGIKKYYFKEALTDDEKIEYQKHGGDNAK